MKFKVKMLAGRIFSRTAHITNYLTFFNYLSRTYNISAHMSIYSCVDLTIYIMRDLNPISVRTGISGIVDFPVGGRINRNIRFRICNINTIMKLSPAGSVSDVRTPGAGCTNVSI